MLHTRRNLTTVMNDFLCVMLTGNVLSVQLTAQVLENRDIGFGMVDAQKDVKVAKRLGTTFILKTV